MPPKKKARLPSGAASTPSIETQDAQTPIPATPDAAAKAGSVTLDLLNDPWTDEQETSLYKGVIRWKPVGVHKHFRMIAISQHLRNNGYTTPSDDHTRIPGIWTKLKSSYNLEALDDRENSFGDDASDDSNPAKEPFSQFRLPPADFGDRMFSRRLAQDGSASPSWLQQQSTIQQSTGIRRASAGSTAGKTRSPSASVRGQKAATKALGPRRTRRSGLQAELEPQTSRLESENPSETAETGETAEVTEEDGNADKDVVNDEDVDTGGQTEDAAAGSPAGSGAKGVGRAGKGRAQKRRGVGVRRGARRR